MARGSSNTDEADEFEEFEEFGEVVVGDDGD